MEAGRISAKVQQLFGARPVIFFSKFGGGFSDNLKYFFLFVQQHGGNAWFVGVDAPSVQLVQALGFKAVLVNDPAAAALIDEAQYLIADETGIKDWIHGARLDGKRLVQLWHGSPIKRIGLIEAWLSPTTTDDRRRWLERRYSDYYAVVSPSDWFSRIFTLCFQSQAILKTGYPRNDVLVREPTEVELANAGVDYAQLKALRGQVTIGYFLPTYREQLGSIFTSARHDWAAFNEFLRARNIVLLVKPHMYDKAGLGVLNNSQFSHLLPVEPLADIYPVLGLCDFMITDYSSVLYDFLLLDRPQLFFVPDYNSYTTEDRGFIYDFPLMAPGPLCASLDELCAGLEQIVAGEDPFVLERAQVNAIANECPAAGASERIVDDLLELASLQEAA